MESNADIIVQNDGYKTVLFHLYSTEEPKASVVILHGMVEHHKRYFDFAKFLNTNGIDVYLYDHRGHGTDKVHKELGFFDETKGYKKVVNDAIEVMKYVKKNNRCKKLFLLGHSMGSLIARNVIQQYDEMDGVILSGTTHPQKSKTTFGLFFSSLIQRIYGPKHRSPLFNNIMFGGSAYTKLISRTSFDWLSRNNPSVGAYIHDPFCGFICTISFYHDLLKIVSIASTPSLMKKTRNSLPLFIISGDHDPVGASGKEITHLVSVYKKWGYNRVTSKLYPDCRHELLQELNAEEIMKDILSWMMKQS
jgi:alpha-beta hydrolase superfamily lysophospholipase